MLRKRIPKDPRLAVLGLTEVETQSLSRHASVVVAPAGRELCIEGVTRPQLVWLLSGHAVVTRSGEPVALLGPGDVAGEISMVTDHAACTAGVVLLEEAVVAALSRPEWQAASSDAPALADRLRAIAEQRLAA